MDTAAVTASRPQKKRWLSTTNPWLEQKERFETALTREQFRTWVRLRWDQRYELCYPDRPPDAADDFLTYQRWDLTEEGPLEVDRIRQAIASPAATTMEGRWWETSGLANISLTFGHRDDAWFVYRVVRTASGTMLHDILRLSWEIVGEGDIDQEFRKLDRRFGVDSRIQLMGSSRHPIRVTVDQIAEKLPCAQPEPRPGMSWCDIYWPA